MAFEKNPNLPSFESPILPPGNTLTLEQKKVLGALLEFQTVKEALAFSGVSDSKHRYWLRTDESYAEAVKRLGDGLLAEARAKVQSLLPEAAEVLESALKKTHSVTIHVTCPECDHGFEVEYNDAADFKTRTKIAVDILKARGPMTPTVKVEGEIKHRDLSLEDRIAVARVARGEAIPPDVFQSLRQRGLIPEQTQSNSRTEDSDTLEGEYRALPEGQQPPS